MAQTTIGLVDPTIFESLQAKIDEDVEAREKIFDILHSLQKQSRNAQSALAKAHSTPSNQLESVIDAALASTRLQADTIGQLAIQASKYPYYKYNSLWSRDVQNACEAILFTGWLGGKFDEVGDCHQGKLFTIEDVGQILKVPVNLKDEDGFHLSIEEYLGALITLIEELARLAVNSVTLGDYARPLQISQFTKDIHAGFQMLNLKNDWLRKRSDSIKYNVKKVEDVVYDLSLRNLIPKNVKVEDTE